MQGTPEASIVRNMTRSIEALDQSFGAMLDISRLEAGSMEVNLQHFALRDVFRRLHLHFAGLAETAGWACASRRAASRCAATRSR